MTDPQMIKIVGRETVVEALSVVDRALSSFMHRELVSSSEVTDVLLDVRTALNRPSQSSTDGSSDLSDVDSGREVPAQA